MTKALFVLVPCLFLTASASPHRADTSEEERAREVLREGLESKDPEARVQTVIAVSMIGRSEIAISRLEHALTDKDVRVRVAAVNALADLKAKQSVPVLRKTLEDDEVPEVAFAAAKALYTLGDPSGKEALIDVYDRTMKARSNALRKRAREFLAKFYSVKSSVMVIVTEGVGFTPVPGVGAGFSALTELLSDPNLSTRASVVLLLGQPKTKEANDLLTQALRDKDWSVRASAAQIISQTGRLELQNELSPLLNDPKPKVRFRVAAAYVRLDIIRGHPLR